MIADPFPSLLSHTFSREDLFLDVFCRIDDWMIAGFGSSNVPRRRGPTPHAFTDAEVLTILLVGELCQCRRERAWLRQVRGSYRHLFPGLLEDSRFSRRAQAVRCLLPRLRKAILVWADADLEPFRILDSFPMPLCACYRIHQSSMPISGSTFGYNSSKRCYYFGLHPQLLITFSGFIEDVMLAPGNWNDTPALAAYLDQSVELGQDLSDQIWLMDKGYRNPTIVRWAKERLGLSLIPRQSDPKGGSPSFFQQTHDKIRKVIEGVLSVLTENFGIEHILARTDIGLYRRVEAKVTAFSLARYYNRVLGLEPMNIARYAV
jgi:hypothetical protein